MVVLGVVGRLHEVVVDRFHLVLRRHRLDHPLDQVVHLLVAHFHLDHRQVDHHFDHRLVEHRHFLPLVEVHKDKEDQHQFNHPPPQLHLEEIQIIRHRNRLNLHHHQ